MHDKKPDTTTHPTGEKPIIIIERDDKDEAATVEERRVWWKPSWHQLIEVVLLLLLLLLAFAGYRVWGYFHRIGVPISITPEENIEKLKLPARQETAEVVMTSDSILGVALDFYALHGLRATLEFQEPDTADHAVFLYSRSADHTPANEYEGSLVVQGRELQSDRSRLGYMAMLDNQMVIGISRSDMVKDYVAEQGGSFFRQYILVSNGVLPGHFRLHGKVERRAIGRIGDTLYFIATRHQETLWDFADALREYGFSDAIYITGGNDYNYYRSRDGKRHDIADPANYPHTKWAGIIPWLVFRKAE